MKYFNTIVIALITLYLVTSSTAYAAPADVQLRVNAMFSKTKVVRFTLLNDSNAPMELKVGDKVLYGKYSGTEVTIDAETYLILRESDVLAVVA